MTIVLFFSASQSSNGLALATLFTAAAILVLGLAVVARARGSLVSLLFFAIAVAAAGWLGSFSAIHQSENFSHALAWAHIAFFFASLIPAAIFHFTAVYVGRRQELRGAIVFCWMFCAAVALVGATTSLFTVGLWHYSWGYYPRGSPWDISYVAVFAGMLVASIRLLRRAARDVEGASGERARALMYAFIASSFALWDFLPMIGVGLVPVGFLAILAFTGIAANAIWRHQLVELTPEYAASQILATMKGAVIVADLAGKIRVINHGAASLLGYNEEDLVGKHIRTIIDPEGTVSSGELLQSQGMLDQQMGWRNARGGRVDVVASSSHVRDSAGVPVGVVYVAADVTERRRGEQALRESEHRYRTLFDGNPLPMWVYDHETLRFIAVNEAASHHYGFSKDEFLHMTIADIRPPEQLPQMQDALAHLKDRNRGGIFRHRKKDGTLFDAEISSFEFVSGGRGARLVIAVDVTERERAEERLRNSEKRYRLLFERNLAGVFRTTLDGRILDCNQALADSLGYASRDELLALDVWALYHERGDREQFLQQLQRNHALTNLRLHLKKKDGSSITGVVNVSMIPAEGGETHVLGTMVEESVSS